MSGLLSSLPAPTRPATTVPPPRDAGAGASGSGAGTAAPPPREPPPYGSVERRGFVPRSLADFGDGGAFPEVRVAQFPLDMGRPGAVSAGRTLAVGLTSSGAADVAGTLARAGAPPGRAVAVGHAAMVPKLDRLHEVAPRPDADEEAATVAATKAALAALVAGKVAATQVKAVPKAPNAPTYIKYTPAGGAVARPDEVGGRIIKMQDMPVDPLAPPKFRHTRVPRAPGSPPAPVLHSPPKPATAEERKDWTVPPCVSNWKNAKGFTIPLDKRLAADGRGLQEVAINDGFAKFAEALYVAEQTARQAVEMRANVAREVAAQESERREAELRELAAAARRERAGGVGAAEAPLPPPPPRDGGGGGGAAGLPPPPDLPPPPPRRDDGNDRDDRRRRDDDDDDRRRRSDRDDRGDDADRRRRDALRADRRRERERDRRLEAAAAGSKRSKTTRDADRDVSERVALGQAAVGGGGAGGGGEALYDQRLFNQGAGGGVGSGLAAEDTYNLYDKPLFADRGSSLYRPRRDGGEGGGAAGDRAFKPDVGFAGAEGSTAAAAAGDRGGPVQFERAPEADPFGLDDFIGSVADGGKK